MHNQYVKGYEEMNDFFDEYVKIMNMLNDLIDEASRLPCPDVQAWYSHNYA
jgi:hypothetical protein